ncbi:hypothetical protein LTR37_005819 [Vermiconidia calcicola]|uniref:Uncharacterized protein n=1 Tax=Vermiconidia calcicola TaxID=1690605 RepID=A0ACC3NIC8_9PEZI|nr:hypothetical protein LTR37_005819 [Vermiconidia calcicola]
MILLWLAWKIGGHIGAAQDTYKIPVTSRDSIYKDPDSTADAVTTDTSTATTNAATNSSATRSTRRPTRKQWNRTHDEGCMSSTGSRSTVKFEPLLSAKAREELLHSMHDASDVDDFQETTATLEGYSRMGHFCKDSKEEEKKEEWKAKEEERQQKLIIPLCNNTTTHTDTTPDLSIYSGEQPPSTYWSPPIATKMQRSALLYCNRETGYTPLAKAFCTPTIRISCYRKKLLLFRYKKNASETEPLAGLTTEDAYTKRIRADHSIDMEEMLNLLAQLSLSTSAPAPSPYAVGPVISESTALICTESNTDTGDDILSTSVAVSAKTSATIASELEQSLLVEEVVEEGGTEGEDSTPPSPQPSGEQAQPTSEPAANDGMAVSGPGLMGGIPHQSSEGGAPNGSDVLLLLPQPSGGGSDAMDARHGNPLGANNSDGGAKQSTPHASSESVAGGGGDGGDRCSCPEVEMGDGRPVINVDQLKTTSYRRVPKRALDDAESSSPHLKRRCQGAAQLSQNASPTPNGANDGSSTFQHPGVIPIPPQQTNHTDRKPSLLMRRAGVEVRPTISVLPHKREHDEYIDSDFAVDIDGVASMDGDASKAVKIVPVDAGIDPEDAAKVKRVPTRGGDSHYTPGSDCHWSVPEKDRNRLKWVKPDEAPKLMMSWLRVSKKAIDDEKWKPEDSTLEVIKLRLQQIVDFGLNNEGRWNEVKVSKDLIRSVGKVAEDLNSALMVAWKESGAPRTRNLVQEVVIKSALAGECVEVLRQLVRACELYKGDHGGKL